MPSGPSQGYNGPLSWVVGPMSTVPFHAEVGPKTMAGTLLELYRHKTWATLRLIELCQGLADEHLDATIPGTFGTVRETLRHLVELKRATSGS